MLRETSPFKKIEAKDTEVIQQLYDYVQEYEEMREEFKNPREYYLQNRDS